MKKRLIINAARGAGRYGNWLFFDGRSILAARQKADEADTSRKIFLVNVLMERVVVQHCCCIVALLQYCCCCPSCRFVVAIVV
jgi:hypothetical protein